ncbi:hypothetical protein LEP1GSC163_4273 [Leptospira santarosai str. CBC379]|nr:hypothetical protein LEP1GSC163_4273 [Leptospira santarosai str. CBC379]
MPFHILKFFLLGLDSILSYLEAGRRNFFSKLSDVSKDRITIVHKVYFSCKIISCE